MKRQVLLMTLIVLAAPVPALAQVSPECGGLSFTDIGGPWDYNDAADRAEMLGVVEAGHFDTNVETLRSGLSSIDPIDDIDYTLRRFPNHHRALFSMSRYFLHNQEIALTPTASRKTPDCYFELARAWRPDDGVVHMINGIYLHRLGRHNAALLRYREAARLLPEYAEIHYNLGLLYFDLKDYPTSRDHAEKAYALGYPLPGLQKKLEKVGF